MKNLVKLTFMFTLSFVILLIIMTFVVKLSRPDPVPSDSTMADSTAVPDSLAGISQRDAYPGSENLVDSLQALVSQMESEKESLQLQLAQMQLSSNQEENTTIANAKQLAKIYENMAPQDAAIIITTLNLNMAVEIIAAMKDRQAARILSSMDPNRAAEISKKIISNR